MAENIVYKDIKNIQLINEQQQQTLTMLQTQMASQHYYCYGWLSGQVDCTISDTNIQFNNVFGYCWDWNYGEYCVPEKGLYHVDFSIYSNNKQTIDSSAFRVCILIDDDHKAMVNNGYGGATVSGTFLCTKGQRIKLGTYSSWKFSLYGEQGHNYFSIYQVCPIP